MDSPDDRSHIEKADSFERAVAAHYRSLGYTVTHNVALAGNQIDLLAGFRAPDGHDYSLMIECKFRTSGNVGVDQVNSLAEVYRAVRVPHLIRACTIVTTFGFSVQARAAAEKADIRLVTFDEIASVNTKVPVRLAHVLAEHYKARIDALPVFVNGRGFDHATRQPVTDIVGHIYGLLISPTPTVTTLVGGAGTGKTTQLLEIAEQPG